MTVPLQRLISQGRITLGPHHLKNSPNYGEISKMRVKDLFYRNIRVEFTTYHLVLEGGRDICVYTGSYYGSKFQEVFSDLTFHSSAERLLRQLHQRHESGEFGIPSWVWRKP